MDSAGSSVPVWLGDRLLERRVVMLVGPLDDAAALRVSAELMTLDATGSEPIELHMASAGDDPRAALMVVDTLDLVGAPTRAHALGEVAGTAVAVFAACSERTAAAHAGFVLREPTVRFSGSLRGIESVAVQHRLLRDRLVERLARAMGCPMEQLAADLQRGCYLDVTEARARGLLTRAED